MTYRTFLCGATIASRTTLRKHPDQQCTVVAEKSERRRGCRDLRTPSDTRTTLDLDDALIARTEAARRRITLAHLIERGLVREVDAASGGEPPRELFRSQMFGDPNATLDLAEYERRVRGAVDDEWAMRQDGLLPFRDPDGAAE